MITATTVPLPPPKSIRSSLFTTTALLPQTFNDICYVPLSATDGNCSYAGVLNYWDNDYTTYVNSV